MKQSLLVLGALSSVAAFAADLPAGTYRVDADHAKVGFEIEHLVISTVDGKFTDVQGTVTLGKKITDSQFNAVLDVASIDTGVKKRDDHLRGPDFFDAKKHPKITFKSKKVSGTPNKLKILGDLTIKGVTKEVVLNGKYTGDAQDPWGNQRVGFKAEGRINRRDFGLTYGELMEKGPMIGDEVELSLAVEAIKEQKLSAK